MRLIRVPHVFSFLAARSSGCIGECLAIRRAVIVGLLGFAVLCGAILMGRVDAHAQARWPSGSVSESIRRFGDTSEVKVISRGDTVVQATLDTQTCAVTASTNPAAPCYYCPENSRNNRCVSQSRSANITECNLNTDGACTTECKEDPDPPANRPVLTNNSGGGSTGSGTGCRVTGAAAHYSQCCFQYCLGQCQASGSPCGPWNPAPPSGGGGSNTTGPSSGGGSSPITCPTGYIVSADGRRCVSTTPSCPPGRRFDGNGHCVVNQPSGSGPRCPTGQVLNAQGNCVSQQPVPPTCWPCPNFIGCCRNGCAIDGKCRS